MSVDQKIKERFCGYCGEIHEGDMVEFMAHLSVCEKLLVRYLRKTSKPDEPNKS